MSTKIGRSPFSQLFSQKLRNSWENFKINWPLLAANQVYFGWSLAKKPSGPEEEGVLAGLGSNRVLRLLVSFRQFWWTRLRRSCGKRTKLANTFRPVLNAVKKILKILNLPNFYRKIRENIWQIFGAATKQNKKTEEFNFSNFKFWGVFTIFTISFW